MSRRVALLIGLASLVAPAWAGVEGKSDATPARQPESVYTCPADANMTYLLKHLDSMAETMAGQSEPCPGIISESPADGPRRDIMAVCDAAGEIRDGIRKRAALCDRLKAAGDEIESARQTIASKDRLLTMAAGTIGTLQSEWELQLSKRSTKGRSAFGFSINACISTPIGTVQEGDDLMFSASYCYGYRLP